MDLDDYGVKQSNGNTPLDKRQWQALYSVVGTFRLAHIMSKDLILWRNNEPLRDHLIRWSLQVDDAEVTPDPAIVRIMEAKVASYKATKHWAFVEANMEAAVSMTEKMKEGDLANAVAISYLGNNVNFGMDKGEHAPKQALTNNFAQGSVKIISNHNQALAKTAVTKKAQRLLKNAGTQKAAREQVIDAVAVRVVD